VGRTPPGQLALSAASRDGPIGEAWVLSDRTDYQSLVANGPLKGQTLGEVMAQFPEQLMGKLSSRFRRFPLLLKFLDAHEMLSYRCIRAMTPLS